MVNIVAEACWRPFTPGQIFLNMTGQSIIDEFRASWDNGEVPDLMGFVKRCGESGASDVIPQLLMADQFQRWQKGIARPIEKYFNLVPGRDSEVIADLIEEELGYLEDHTGEVDLTSFLQRFSDLPDAVQERLRALEPSPVSGGSARAVESAVSNRTLRRCAGTRLRLLRGRLSGP